MILCSMERRLSVLPFIPSHGHSSLPAGPSCNVDGDAAPARAIDGCFVWIWGGLCRGSAGGKLQRRR